MREICQKDSAQLGSDSALFPKHVRENIKCKRKNFEYEKNVYEPIVAFKKLAIFIPEKG